jgi:hypothetical protein
VWISSVVAQGVDFFGGGEVDAVDLVEDVPQQVARLHAVADAGEDAGDHVAAVVAVGALQAAEVGEQPRAIAAVGPGRFLVVDERGQLLAGDGVVPGRPIPPAVGRLDGGAELLPAQLGFLLPNLFHVVQELEEHHPGEHRQPVEVAVQPFVLPHDVAGGLDQAAEPLGGGQRLLVLGLLGH